MSDNLRKMKPKEITEGQSGAKLQTAVIVGVIGLAVLMGIAFAIGSLGNGKDLTAQTSSASTGIAPSTSTTTTLTSTANIQSVEVPPLSIYKRRNPFKPLVNMVAPTLPTGTTSAGGAGDIAVVVVPPELNSQTNAAGQVLSRAVTLDSVTKQDGQLFAHITVGDQAFDRVAVGQTFGNNFKVLTLDKDAGATILFGDERFTFAVGQSRYW